MKRLLCGLVALGLLVGEAGVANAQPDYGYTLLDVPGATETIANGINNAGQIVGSYFDANSRAHGFLYSGGTYTTLDPPGSRYSLAYGINDAAQIVGWYQKTLLASSQSFPLSGGAYTNIVPPGATGTNRAPVAINNAGQIVGNYEPFVGVSQGFLLSNGTYIHLYQPGSTFTAVEAINNLGQILGVSSLGAFLLSDGTYAPLNVLGAPSGINDLNQIVGLHQDGVDSFLLSDGVYTLLHVPGSELTRATGINDGGEIVGNYIAADGMRHGFLATPVPEPSTLLLLAIGTLGVVGWAWWRR